MAVRDRLSALCDKADELVREIEEKGGEKIQKRGAKAVAKAVEEKAKDFLRKVKPLVDELPNNGRAVKESIYTMNGEILNLETFRQGYLDTLQNTCGDNADLPHVANEIAKLARFVAKMRQALRNSDLWIEKHEIETTDFAASGFLDIETTQG